MIEKKTLKYTHIQTCMCVYFSVYITDLPDPKKSPDYRGFPSGLSAVSGICGHCNQTVSPSPAGR